MNANRQRTALSTTSANATALVKREPKRLAVVFFYDERGVVDDYMIYLIEQLRPFVDKVVFVANGVLDRDGELAVAGAADELLVRENTDFDVGGYKHALNHVGFDKLNEYDELLLLNHTFFGPIFPFSEMFEEMDARVCDFWGITEHGDVKPNPFTGRGLLPRHINSHFIAIRKPMLSSHSFRNYWEEMEPIESYVDSVLKHESKFTKYFNELGYESSVYVDNKDYSSAYPLIFQVDEVISNRCPILKRRSFFHSTTDLEVNAVDLPRAISLLRQTSSYPEGLIWKNVVRSTQLRTLNENAGLMSVLPDVAVKAAAPEGYGRIAVCAHIYYDDMLDEIIGYTNNIPGSYVFLATTDSAVKKQRIEEKLKAQPRISEIDVRIVEQNRGRDMSSLFITFRDEFIDDKYDVVCRIHTKKTPQVEAARGNIFKRHMFENILNSSGYVSNVLDMFASRPWVGLAVPPMVNISYYTFGQAWYTNKEPTQALADELGLRVTLDDHTPVAPFGTMYWFRPAALRKMFAHEWRWSDYNAEPHHQDGSLAHAQERLIAYVAQDAGYTTEHIASAQSAARNYTMIEYKLSAVLSRLPLEAMPWIIQFLDRWRASGYPTQMPETSSGGRPVLAMGAPPTIKQSLREVPAAIKRSIRSRLRRRFSTGA